MYWAIGQRIVEKEQQGKERADYGTYLIKNLAKEIEPEQAADLVYVNWNVVASFILSIQLRPHCGRN